MDQQDHAPASGDASGPASATAPAERDADVARRRLGLRTDKGPGKRQSEGGSNTGGLIARLRQPLAAQDMARRRKLLRYSKFGLPAVALVLLGAIAAWPEINRQLSFSADTAREVAAVRRDSGRMLAPHYSGIDSHDRPYTLTATSGRQVGPSRIDLEAPVMDMSSATGWVFLKADRGTYMQDRDMLDLSGNVTLYRDDGILAFSPIADVDVKSGVISSASWIHADGPFGILDAQGYMLAQNDGVVQFTGPARLVLNDDHIAQPVRPAPEMTPDMARGAAHAALPTKSAAKTPAHAATKPAAHAARHPTHRRTGQRR